jgi:hypothetical protein
MRYLLVSAEPGFHSLKSPSFLHRCSNRNGTRRLATALNYLQGSRDTTVLGHCNFQFYGNAAGQLFQFGGVVGSPSAASKFCEMSAAVRRQVRQRLPLEDGMLS